MHESGIVASLVARAEAIAEEACAEPRRIGIRVGASSGVDPAVVQAHWARLAGPVVARAALDIEVDDDPDAPTSLGVVLSFIDVADGRGR